MSERHPLLQDFADQSAEKLLVCVCLVVVADQDVEQQLEAGALLRNFQPLAEFLEN